MGRVIPPILLGALVVLFLAGCGSGGVDEDTLIPRATSAQLQASVERARELDAAGRCADARAAARDGQERVAALKRIDDALQANVEAWFDHLADQIRTTCGRDEEPDEEETPDGTTTTETTTTETTPDPDPTATPTPEPTETATPAPTATATPTPAPDEGNGNGNGNGGASGDEDDGSDAGGAAPEDGE